MIKQAVTFQEGEQKHYLIEVILNQMKKSYLNWNRESVNDDMIIEDLKFLSKNQLQVPEGIKLKESKDLISKPPTTTYTKKPQPKRTNIKRRK